MEDPDLVLQIRESLVVMFTASQIYLSGVEEKIRRIVSLQLKMDPGKIHADTDFVKTLGADSLDLVEISMRIESEFNIRISDDDREKLHPTVRSLSGYVRKQLRGKNELSLHGRVRSSSQ